MSEHGDGLYPEPTRPPQQGELRILSGGRAVLVQFVTDVDGIPAGTETIPLRWVGTNPDDPREGAYVRAPEPDETR